MKRKISEVLNGDLDGVEVVRLVGYTSLPDFVVEGIHKGEIKVLDVSESSVEIPESIRTQAKVIK